MMGAVVRRMSTVGLAAAIALVVAGFILGGYMDATAASAVPGMSFLMRQPKGLRIALELLVGVPIAFGVAIYAVAEVIELGWFLSAPIRKLSAAMRGGR
jgi:hypothetical protein